MCSSGHIGFIIDVPAKFFPVNSNSSGSTFKIDEISAVQNHFSGSFSARTRMLQFWISCHYFSTTSPSPSACSLKITKGTTILSWLFWTFFLCARWLVFWHTWIFFLPRDKKLVAKTPEWYRKQNISEMKLISKFSSARACDTCDNPRENFLTKGLTFSAQSLKKGETLS